MQVLGRVVSPTLCEVFSILHEFRPPGFAVEKAKYFRVISCDF